MWRRVYFSFPDAAQARQAVGELESAGISQDQMHAIGKADVDLSGLPLATEHQRRDRIWFWEQVFWYGNLIFFMIALAVTGAALWTGSVAWAIIGGLAAMASVVLGERFAVKVPHVHLNEMRVPLNHGEVVLLVDVPREQVRDIEKRVTTHHPEAGLGGVGWTIAHSGV